MGLHLAHSLHVGPRATGQWSLTTGLCYCLQNLVTNSVCCCLLRIVNSDAEEEEREVEEAAAALFWNGTLKFSQGLYLALSSKWVMTWPKWCLFQSSFITPNIAVRFFMLQASRGNTCLLWSHTTTASYSADQLSWHSLHWIRLKTLWYTFI